MSNLFFIAASTTSGAIITASLVCVAILVRDINTMYEDAMDDLEEFKVKL